MTEAERARLEEAVDIVLAEAFKAIRKFRPFRSGHEGASIIREEFDEFFEAVRANNLKESRKEAIQVAAMAVRYMVDVLYQHQMDNLRRHDQ